MVDVPESLGAKECITVPYRMTCLQRLTIGDDAQSGGGGSYGACFHVTYSGVSVNGCPFSGGAPHCMAITPRGGGSGGVPPSGGGGGSYYGGSGGGYPGSSSGSIPETMGGGSNVCTPPAGENGGNSGCGGNGGGGTVANGLAGTASGTVSTRHQGAL